MKADRWFVGAGLASVGAVAAALVSQYAFDMQPCPWCVLQRVLYLAIALACLLGLVWRQSVGRQLGAGAGLAFALSGMSAALWQHFAAASSASCNLTLADKIVSGWLHLDSLLPDVFSARASCADAAVKLLGIPYDFWSVALFASLSVGFLAVLTNATHRRPSFG